MQYDFNGSLIWRGGDSTARKSANYQYINEFADKNYDRITILVPKGGKARIRDAAKAQGKTISDYITSMIPVALVGRWKLKTQEQTQTNE